MRFALKEVTGKASGKAIDVATAAVRSCCSILKRDRKAYLVSGLAKCVN